jgi:hypothetical protein
VGGGRVKFTATVEPAEKMKGLEVPPAVIEALAAGPRPPVVITVGGHTWKSRVAIMRGRFLLGVSKANREAAGLVTGERVEVDLVVDAEPRVITVPDDLAEALDAAPGARAAWDRLSYSHQREHLLAIDGAKKPETRARRIAKAVAALS